MTGTTLLAVWGSLIGTASFGWNILRERRDRAVVRIRGYVARIAELQPAREPDWRTAMSGDADGFRERDHARRQERVLCFTITNVGRRVVRINHFGWSLLGTSERVANLKADDKPYTLGEGESYTFTRPLELVEATGGIDRFHVVDSVDRTWSMTRAEVENLERAAREALRQLRAEREA
jgi:hypothetical protein